MPWYYYSGSIVKAIPVRPGVSLAVQPRTRVEILNDGVREVQTLIRKGVLRRTGRPVDAKPLSVEPVSAEEVRKVTQKSAMAASFAEKGKTFSKAQAPKTKSGKPEMTEGELQAKKTNDEGMRASSDKSIEKDADIADMLKKADDARVEKKKGAESKKRWSQ